MKSETSIRDLTRTAREGLTGNWWLSMGDMVVYLLLLFGVMQVPFASLIFAAPLMVGLRVYFLQTIRKQSNPFPLLFSGFDQFGTAWCSYMLIKLIQVAWMLPLVAAGAAIHLFVPSDLAGIPPALLPLLPAIPGSVMAGVMIALQMRYALVLYVVADDEPVRAREAVRRGRELMAGNYGRLFTLWLRFFGWGLLCMLTLGLGFIWLFSYMSAAMAAFYDDLA